MARSHIATKTNAIEASATWRTIAIASSPGNMLGTGPGPLLATGKIDSNNQIAQMGTATIRLAASHSPEDRLDPLMARVAAAKLGRLGTERKKNIVNISSIVGRLPLVLSARRAKTDERIAVTYDKINKTYDKLNRRIFISDSQ